MEGNAILLVRKSYVSVSMKRAAMRRPPLDQTGLLCSIAEHQMRQQRRCDRLAK